MVEHTQIGHKVTLEEYNTRFAGRRYEYIDGYAVPMGPEFIDDNGEISVSPTKPNHGMVVAFLTSLIQMYVYEHNLGGMFGAETGFIMDAATNKIRAADIAFVRKERLKGLDFTNWLPFTPDLAVEVISEYEKAVDIREKAQSYLDNGTPLLLLVYPSSRVIDVYRPDQPIITLREGDTLDGADVLPGFSVEVDKIFSVLDASQ